MRESELHAASAVRRMSELQSRKIQANRAALASLAAGVDFGTHTHTHTEATHTHTQLDTQVDRYADS